MQCQNIVTFCFCLLKTRRVCETYVRDILTLNALYSCWCSWFLLRVLISRRLCIHLPVVAVATKKKKRRKIKNQQECGASCHSWKGPNMYSVKWKLACSARSRHPEGQLAGRSTWRFTSWVGVEVGVDNCCAASSSRSGPLQGATAVCVCGFWSRSHS